MTNELSLTLDGAAGSEEIAGETPLSMDEAAFRSFYARTARSLRGYLHVATRDPDLADDLLQEAYLRFLRAGLPEMEEAHRKNYLFRIATNLVRDRFRRSDPAPAPLSGTEGEAGAGTEDRIHLRSDLARTLQELKPRERDLLWLAYVEGSKHAEIADALGLKSQSIRPMLFRARRKLAGLLRKRGVMPGTSRG